MASDKEKCFQKALDEYNDSLPDDKKWKIKHQQPWAQGHDGVWRQEERGLWAGLKSMWKSIYGPTPGTVKQLRIPDLTVDDNLVVDTKFTRADGKVDEWGTKPGAGNGRTQREDYNDINKQTNPDATDLKLDPSSCNCKGRKAEPEPVEVPEKVPDPGMFFAPLPAPGVVPAPGVAPVPVEPVPIFEPVPVF